MHFWRGNLKVLENSNFFFRRFHYIFFPFLKLFIIILQYFNIIYIYRLCFIMFYIFLSSNQIHTLKSKIIHQNRSIFPSFFFFISTFHDISKRDIQQDSSVKSVFVHVIFVLVFLVHVSFIFSYVFFFKFYERHELTI